MDSESQHINIVGPVREMSFESLSEPSTSIKNPSWAEVEYQIKRLPTLESGAVFLKTANGNLLSIGGDQGKGFLVFVEDGMGIRYLQPPSSERKGIVQMVVGFQPGEFPRRTIVDLEASISAAHVFFHKGRIEAGADWTTDGRSVEL